MAFWGSTVQCSFQLKTLQIAIPFTTDSRGSYLFVKYRVMLNQSRQLQFSPPWSLDAHHATMAYLWSFTIDLAVFLVLYKHRLAWFFMHVIIGLGVSFLTLLLAIPILLQFGIPQQENDNFSQRHAIIGAIVIAVILAQVLMGFASNIMKQIRWSSPLALLVMNTGHKYTGYGLLLLAKVQVFLIMKTKGDQLQLFWALIAVESGFLLAWILRKLFSPTLSQTIMPNYENLKVRMVKNVKEVSATDSQPMGVFGNYIFDLTPLLSFHPAGFRIIDGVKYRDLDRYLYGMYRTERDPRIPAHAHSSKALTLVGNPIAKLNIPQLYKHLSLDYHSVTLKRIGVISQAGGIYQIELQAESMMPFEYLGYSFVHQLGRFFSLTLNKKVTRLYSNVGFMNARNVDFMGRVVFGSMGVRVRQVKSVAMVGGHRMTQEQGKRRNGGNQGNSVVLMMKKYQNGQLTQTLIDGEVTFLQLSCSRGEGLHLSELRAGKVIIIAGGTGLIPFCDLIDLLFKSLLIQLRPELTSTILSNDPVLRSNPFRDLNFMLYLSVTSLEQIHPLTLAQLNELTKHPSYMRLMLKVSSYGREMHLMMNPNVSYTRQKFSTLLEKTLLGQVYERMWVCGPPELNADMIEVFERFEIPPERYLIL